MNDIVLIPPGMIEIIPIFGGDSRLLPIFIKNCEYIIDKYVATSIFSDQEEYVFRLITSRLRGDAANIVGEVNTWEELKRLLNTFFGKTDNEVNLLNKLRGLKLKRGENCLDFGYRIQRVLCNLVAASNQSSKQQDSRKIKENVYTEMAVKVFKQHLPPDLSIFLHIRNGITMKYALECIENEIDLKRS